MRVNWAILLILGIGGCTQYQPVGWDGHGSWAAARAAANQPRPAGGERTAAATYPGRHVVQPGETLSELAVRYRTSMASLAAANRVSAPYQVQTGQVLAVPAAPRRQAPVTVAPPPPVLTARDTTPPTPVVAPIRVASLAPVVARVLPGKLPGVVFMLIGGVLIGPEVLANADPDDMSLLSTIGLSFLFLLAGYELEPTLMRQTPGRIAIRSWFVSAALSVAVTAVLFGQTPGLDRNDPSIRISGRVITLFRITDTVLASIRRSTSRSASMRW